MKNITAAAALVLALGGGVVGGTLAVAGITGGSQPSTATIERTTDEAPAPDTSVAPTPVVIPSPAPVASEPTQPQEENSVPAPKPAPVVVEQDESASEAADRARREADRAETEADRAEKASPQPAPVAVEVKPACENGQQTTGDQRVNADGSRQDGDVRTCVDGKWVVTKHGKYYPPPKPPAPQPMPVPAPSEPDAVTPPSEG